MIDWLLNDILWGWGRKRAYVLNVVLLGTGIGYCNASTTKTNRKALEVSILMNWTLKGLKLLKERSNCSRTKYSILLEERAYPNDGNW